MGIRRILLVVACASCFLPALARAQNPSASATPTEVSAPNTEGLDPAAATKAWLDSVPAEKRAKSDAYFEGGYWMLLWDFLVASAIMIFFLASGLSVRLRDFAEGITRFRFVEWLLSLLARVSTKLRDFAERILRSRILQTLLYAIPFLLITTIVTFPLTYYEGFVRDHAYGLSTQSFGSWLSDQAKQGAVLFVVLLILLVVLYGVFRHAPRTWWLWAVAVFAFFSMLGSFIFPVYVAPLTNKYQPLTDASIRDPILQMARANEIPVDNVYEFDASRQSNRVSANVSGFLGTTRISLNDNLLKQCSLPEIRMVMAHEMGHYVLNHGAKLVTYSAIINFVSFGLLFVVFNAAIRRRGAKWRLRDISDLAALPLLVLIYATISFLLTPVGNTVTRVTEREADAFGINTAREPDGFAKVALKLGSYRKLNPGEIEEFIFFDHPSGRTRIRMAMDWKAARLPGN
jgi:Zn-dependent protease with chaperone function